MPYLKLKLLYLQILQFILQDKSVQQALLVVQGNIREWVCRNKLILNTKKTRVMLVCSTRKRPTQHGMQLSTGEVQIDKVAETKLPGVQLDNCLSWLSPITHLCKKNKKCMHDQKESKIFTGKDS